MVSLVYIVLFELGLQEFESMDELVSKIIKKWFRMEPLFFNMKLKRV